MSAPFMSIDLAGGIDVQADACVVDDRGCTGRIKGRFLDPMPWGRLIEIGIDPAFDKGIVPRHGLFEIGRRHRHALVLHDDLLGEIGEPVGAEDEAGSDVHLRWLGCQPSRATRRCRRSHRSARRRCGRRR
jgi:hypothetical protein